MLMSLMFIGLIAIQFAEIADFNLGRFSVLALIGVIMSLMANGWLGGLMAVIQCIMIIYGAHYINTQMY